MSRILCYLLPLLMTSLISNSHAMTRDHDPVTRNADSRGREALQHSYQPMTSLSRYRAANPCRFKRCYVGKKCVVEGLTGRGTCVCKRHCHQVEKAVCGTDGGYYMNRCEMHKTSCMSGQDIYDAKHKDCFYKKSVCDATDFEQFLQLLLQYHESTASMSRLHDVIDDDQSQKIEYKVESHEGQMHNDVNVTTSMTPSDTNNDSTSVKLLNDVAQATTIDRAALYDDIITNDVIGDSVKRLFRFLDLDGNEMAGSEDLFEVSLVEGLDSIFPPPCSLFHLLHSADTNRDNAIDIKEIMEIYNVTLLHLPEEKNLVRQRAVYGLPVSLFCGIEGEHNPTWRRGGSNLLFQKETIQIDGVAIRFLSANPNLAGNFTCHARGHPRLFQTIELSIIVKPRVQVHPKTQHVSPQNSATVFCRAGGIPLPHITWMRDDKPLDRDRVLLLENNTELHINSARSIDSAAYSCLATNAASTSQEIAAVIVDDVMGAPRRDEGAFYIFHDGGITIIEPASCQALRFIEAKETLPGLLRQDKLCSAHPSDQQRVCKWSEAVAVGSRFVYAAQPEENRLVVLELKLQRVIEVLATDPLPSSLHYVTSSDQLFVVCWMDWSRDRSVLLVVHAAAVPGAHVAAQIQPLDGGRTVDFSVFTFFVPHESIVNEHSSHGFIAHQHQQSIYKINLVTLVYEDDVIDLSEFNCMPIDFEFQPIGGVLEVTCEGEGHLHVEALTGRVMGEEPDLLRQFVSSDARYLLRSDQNYNVIMYRISDSGNYDIIMNWKTNFTVCDVTFVPKLSDPDQVIAYLSSETAGDVAFMDSDVKTVRMIREVPPQITQSKQTSHCRPLVSSAWYDRHLATSGDYHIDVINLNDNKVACRFNDVTNTTVIVWADGQL